ncbi:MAG: hypothetical protein ACYDA6_02630 [Solirubrobacteraceae bacterium]
MTAEAQRLTIEIDRPNPAAGGTMRQLNTGALPRFVPARLHARSHAAITALVAGATLLGAVMLPSPAGAANQFTLDKHADSIGPVVVDQSGNGYVAWLHTGSPDAVMFCKLAPGGHTCPHQVTLPAVRLIDPTSGTDTPFPVLGPGNYVYVVAPSYDTNQMVIWQSSNGGTTFSTPWVSTPNGEQTSGCLVETDLNDVLGINAYGGEYARSQGTASLPGKSPSALEFQMSSSNPYINWTFAYWGEGCVVPLSTTSSPGAIPWQYFPFGGGELGSQDSTLGWASGTSSGCAESAAGDEVTAYMQASSPPNIRYYRYSAPTGPCKITEENLSPSASHLWHGPTTLTAGAYPRLAGGKSGLFLLSGDGVTASNGAPSAVDIRAFDLSTHSFGSPLRLSGVSDPSILNPDSGGLGENNETGELAAVWPDVGGSTGLMSLFISTDGGAHFSAAQQIAALGYGYSGGDDARVAVAADGTGFVTFEDAGGLHVADLTTLGTAYKRLVVHHKRTIELPVTCEAPKGVCKASARVRLKGHTIASGHLTVASGRTENLRLTLNSSGRSSFASAGGHLKATLTLTVTHPPGSPERVVQPTVLVS